MPSIVFQAPRERCDWLVTAAISAVPDGASTAAAAFRPASKNADGVHSGRTARGVIAALDAVA